jgi:EcsC protein family
MTGKELDTPEFTDSDLDDLRLAKSRLENPSLTAQISDVVGTPIEKVLQYVPERLNGKIGDITHQALLKGLEMAIASFSDTQQRRSKDWLHKLVATGTGATGGLFGLAALAIELPVSTGIILRSIADIARSEGYDLTHPEVRLSCLEVFALGGTTASDDAVEGGYWVVRGVMAQSLKQAAAYIAEQGFAEEGAPILVRFISKIAARYSTVVTQKAAVKAMPIVGAVSGGTINLLFMNHFQSMAKGHFVVKRLEAKYGTELVRTMYAECDISKASYQK